MNDINVALDYAEGTSDIQINTAVKCDTSRSNHDLWIDEEISGFTKIKNTTKGRKAGIWWNKSHINMTLHGKNMHWSLQALSGRGWSEEEKVCRRKASKPQVLLSFLFSFYFPFCFSSSWPYQGGESTPYRWKCSQDDTPIEWSTYL